jgi:hypothetical protein
MTVSTPATIAADIANAPPGATLVLEGVFQSLPLKASTAAVPGRKPDLTLVMTNAEVIDAVRTTGFDGLHFVDGVYRGGFALSSGKNFSLTGKPQILGTEARAFNGVSLQLVEVVRVQGATIRDCLNGIVLSECVDADIDGNDLERIRKDVINVFASQQVRIRLNASRDQRPMNIGLTNADHPDAVQLYSVAGKPPVQDILIEGNDFDIRHGQGITTTWKPKNGDPRFARLHYRNNRVRAGQACGYGMLGVDGGVIEANVLEGHADAANVVRFIVHESCTDIVWIGENLQGASKGQPAVSWPATVVEPPPAPVDPRIAELEAVLADRNAQLEAAQASVAAGIEALGAAISERDAALAKLAAVRGSLETLNIVLGPAT